MRRDGLKGAINAKREDILYVHLKKIVIVMHMSIFFCNFTTSFLEK